MAATANRSAADRGSVVVALLTPFDADGRVDVGALERHVESLVEAGVDALMPAGTTGEGVLLDDDEVVTVVERSCASTAPSARSRRCASPRFATRSEPGTGSPPASR